MTNKEIKKALDCCSVENNCTQCPYYSNGNFKCLNYKDGECEYIFFKDLLDLINRHEQENESLKAEVERLKKGWKADVILTANIKAEAYKEFKEKVSEEITNIKRNAPDRHITVIVETLSQLQQRMNEFLKELVG